MKSHSIVVSDADMDRLRRLVMALKHVLFRDQLQVESLNQTLESAEVASSERIPRDIIRMNSRIRVLDLDTGKKDLYTLVFPEHANISAGLISVLAPVGIALLGHKKGEDIEARVPGGIRRLRVERVLYRTGEKRVRPRQTENPSLARNIQTAGLAA
jgi:regulator of nucleoside diphosphate kinase